MDFYTQVTHSWPHLANTDDFTCFQANLSQRWFGIRQHVSISQLINTGGCGRKNELLDTEWEKCLNFHHSTYVRARGKETRGCFFFLSKRMRKMRKKWIE